MSVFVDTSALYALLDADDENHDAARRTLSGLREDRELLTHNYVLVETAAVVQRRIGWQAARDFLERLAPALELVWVEGEIHRAGVAAFLTSDRPAVSLVDMVSFEVMRLHGLETVFAFDRDFQAEGFETIP